MTVDIQDPAIDEMMIDHTQLPSETPSITDEDVRRTLAEIGFVPDHLDLPYEDGTFVKNFLELPQSILLTDSFTPVVARLHPDGDYCIGQDCGIYWSFSRALSEKPTRGAVAPDWFYAPNARAMPPGEYRRSYVVWQEDLVPPLIVLEFASGDGSEERDPTPYTGKFWVYEHAIRPAFYGIYEIRTERIEMYHLVENRFELKPPDEHGHYFFPQIGVALGLWQGSYQNHTALWMRWWDEQGNMLLIGAERAQQAEQREQRETERAQQAEARAAKLAEMLRAMGVNPDE